MQQMRFGAPAVVTAGLRGVGALVAVAALAACNPELDYGAWEADLSGTAYHLDGSEADWSGTVSIDIAYDKSRGTLGYELTLCDGLVSFYSAEPCFNTIDVLDTTDGLVGTQEESWQAAFEDGDGAIYICQGTESISILGDPSSHTESDLELTYHLGLSSSSSSRCAEELGGAEARILASGTMTHVEP